MGESDCLAILAHGGIGRAVFVAERGPVALLVNYALLGGDVVFRTHEATSIARAVRPSALARPGSVRIGFEVDYVDHAVDQGWSVLVTGDAHEVVDATEVAEVEGVVIDPWSGEGRHRYVRLHPTEVTGRRVGVPPWGIPPPG
jgi:nitroimidazol reductase NimA-like FMN-containing flavoprotein (pyridoxamine 5'-phosphate oxidase superfamily)